MTVDSTDLDRAAAAITKGELVVYPTETVYGLAADALEPGAIERVFAAKRRDRNDPIAFAVPTIEAAESLVRLTPRERTFMQAFLPGPVTVVCKRTENIPDVLTGGRERVGVRVPDHPTARALLERVAPLTATSANLSGTPSVREVAKLSPEIQREVTEILDDGKTPGGGSTVVDVTEEVIHRRGAMADAVATWLREQGPE